MVSKTDFKDWNDGWLKSGHYISYRLGSIYYFEHIIARDFTHWEFPWPHSVAPGFQDDGIVLEDMEITRGYNDKTNEGNIWQMIFGIRGQVYTYIEFPTDQNRHGLPKVPKPTSSFKKVGHFEEWMSPWNEPSFLTEHFLRRDGYERISFDVYNPRPIPIWPEYNIFINKMVTERIGTVSPEGTLTPSKRRFGDVLTRLFSKLIPCTPITLQPISLAAVAPSGE